MGEGHPWVLAKLNSSYLYPSPSPPKFLLTCCLKWYGMVNFIGTKIKRDNLQFTYHDIFFRLTGGHSPLSASGYATGHHVYSLPQLSKLLVDEIDSISNGATTLCGSVFLTIIL